MKIHALFTEVMAHGGIQRYNRQLICALETVTHECNGALRVFSLNDAPGQDRIQGYGQSDRRFLVAALLAASRERPDVVIVGHVNLAPMVPLFRVLVPRARIYVMAHGKEVEARLPVRLWLGVLGSTGVFAVSESTRHLMVSRQHIPARRVHLLYFGFEPKVSASGTIDASSHVGVRLLSVARLNPEDRYKGIDLTVRAVARLKEARSDLHYTIVGDGPDRPYLERLARELEVADRVNFMGNVTDNQLESTYRDCDIFVLPSTHEGLGIVYLEALAHGKPVIGVRAGGVADVIVHEANGLLMRKAAVQTVTDAIERLVMEPRFRVRLGEWGRAHTVPAFSLERMVEQFVSVVRMTDRRLTQHEASSPAFDNVTRTAPNDSPHEAVVVDGDAPLGIAPGTAEAHRASGN